MKLARPRQSQTLLADPGEPYVTSWALSWGNRGSRFVRRQWRKLSSVRPGCWLISIRLCWVQASRPHQCHPDIHRPEELKNWDSGGVPRVEAMRAMLSGLTSLCQEGHFQGAVQEALEAPGALWTCGSRKVARKGSTAGRGQGGQPGPASSSAWSATITSSTILVSVTIPPPLWTEEGASGTPTSHHRSRPPGQAVSTPTLCGQSEESEESIYRGPLRAWGRGLDQVD